jgi:pimeloyl-ACP methyl ester carboxylesterase
VEDLIGGAGIVLRRREQSEFWRRARRDRRRARPPVPPLLPLGTLVRVPGRGDVFVRYQEGPAGAPTLLLLHGWMASADLNWLGTFASLAGRYHVVAMDLRGHGRGIRTTDPFSLEDCADDAAGLLHELGVRDAVVAGYSMGGPVALLLARRHPENVRGLVLVATAAELARTGVRRGMGTFMYLVGPLFRSGLPDRVLTEVAHGRPARLGALAELTPWMAGEMKRLHPSDIVGAGRAIASFDARPWLVELGKPAASVVTLCDRVVAPDQQRSTAAALGAPIIELEGGHAVCVTDPDALGAAVRQAVDLVAGARPHRRRIRGTVRRLRAVSSAPSPTVGSDGAVGVAV